ncbi:BPSS1780 family membrane protein [Luteimonas sp. RD2P54]|uniref:BPSS1780 family membrane protein n=1 Tax=Luteimonas endophytica TaxID=3042023 RepID=A0ABT6J5F1_9GAMM|nr:BPSS1780 family membrane protein [Luteimonas endophytica]MDH5822056.1 BPSS1780 family membrane protein [Luteimonas endophytica]
MTQVRKVSIGDGAEWLLAGFGLLRRSPLGLGLLGAIFGFLTALPLLFGEQLGAFMAFQLVLVILGPVLMGGFVHAVGEVDAGRQAVPAHLLHGFSGGRAPRLVALLLPQVAMAVLAVLLLVVMVGPTQLQEAIAVLEQAEGQANPDPAMFENLPIGRFLLWMLLAFVLGVLTYFFTFVATPQIMFEGRGALESMKRSFAACIRNVPAMILFFVLLIVIVFLVSVGAQLVAVVARLAAGPLAMQFVAQILMMAVLMPVMLGASYRAWQKMLAPADGAAPTMAAPPPSGIEV